MKRTLRVFLSNTSTAQSTLINGEQGGETQDPGFVMRVEGRILDVSTQASVSLRDVLEASEADSQHGRRDAMGPFDDRLETLDTTSSRSASSLPSSSRSS